MQVTHTRTGKTIRLSAPSKLFAQRRETIEVAYPGDIVGFVNPGAFSIGDTISSKKNIKYEGIPSFSPGRNFLLFIHVLVSHDWSFFISFFEYIFDLLFWYTGYLLFIYLMFLDCFICTLVILWCSFLIYTWYRVDILKHAGRYAVVAAISRLLRIIGLFCKRAL